MNIALKDDKKQNFYIASVKKTSDCFITSGKIVSTQGKLIQVGQLFKFNTKKDAEQKLKDLVKIKVKRRGWYNVNLEDLPKRVQSYLEVPPEMRVSPEEMVMIIREAQAERYVIFNNVVGIEDFFDAGIEYLGYEESNNYTLKVFDKFGTLRECFRSRMASINYTERALEASTEKMRKATDAMTLEKGKE